MCHLKPSEINGKHAAMLHKLIFQVLCKITFTSEIRHLISKYFHPDDAPKLQCHRRIGQMTTLAYPLEGNGLIGLHELNDILLRFHHMLELMERHVILIFLQIHVNSRSLTLTSVFGKISPNIACCHKYTSIIYMLL